VSRRSPRSIGDALRAVRAETVPETLLAAVQSCWRQAVGDQVSAQAQPVSERDGVVTIACHSATWAQELDLLGEELLERLNEALSGPQVKAFRFTADAARHDRAGDSL
jgi:predicted nucleic acid-binding Zn ribbon protein